MIQTNIHTSIVIHSLSEMGETAASLCRKRLPWWWLWGTLGQPWTLGGPVSTCPACLQALQFAPRSVGFNSPIPFAMEAREAAQGGGGGRSVHLGVGKWGQSNSSPGGFLASAFRNRLWKCSIVQLLVLGWTGSNCQK